MTLAEERAAAREAYKAAREASRADPDNADLQAEEEAAALILTDLRHRDRGIQTEHQIITS